MVYDVGVLCRGGFRLSRSAPLVAEDRGFLPQKYPIGWGNPPNAILSDSADRRKQHGFTD